MVRDLKISLNRLRSELIRHIKVRIWEEDWIRVEEAANDLRVIDAKLDMLGKILASENEDPGEPEVVINIDAV